tara:strand:+ start:1372 stop:2103 length:732 start_codon:yes stop_codon:yes gene_type:complete
MHLVSVIMPYFKKRNYVEKSIRSVINQTYKMFELIIIYDDEDKSDLNFIKEIIGNNEKVKLVINENNIGAGNSRNQGIKLSNGEFIAFIDSDDYWNENKLARQVDYINKNNFDFVFCNYEKIINDKKKIILSKKSLNYNDLLKSCDIGLSTVILKKNVINKISFPNLKTKEDYVFWLDLTKKNIIAHNQGDVLVSWNKVKNSLSSSVIQKIKDGFIVYYKYQNFNFFKSLYFLGRLSLNSLKK